MKTKTLLSITLFTTLLIAAIPARTFAQATVETQFSTMWMAELTKFNLDERMNLGKVSSASVLINPKESITLSVFRSSNCPAGRFCIMMMPAPAIFKVPNQAKEKDNCGTISYKGSLDQRRTDGSLVEVTVYDHTKNHCPTFVALSATEVLLTVQNARENDVKHSLFYGSALVRTK